ncbi:hypothetical protein [Amycolatopsis cihanbeyliensis]|uniref:Uncharacterized protein n=1 Tax=Amycolatopsis cihanbeyliensis TaxID=1128664 RepID=A0A542DMC6_AMYCI|nr:hypothetical protein [Amycolatopsis cihanbeyliensis]TQJ04144.1 hypothetical protein FB471_3926 [Amycolatopsis cihanbeyliensis]
MTSAGDAYLRGVLDEGEYPQDEQPVNVTGGGSAPGAAPQATTEIDEEIDQEVAEERERLEEHREGGGGSWVDSVARSAASMGGGYSFDAETIATKIREFEDLRDRIADKYDELLSAAQDCTPPSHDSPATSQAAATRASILKAAKHNRQMAEYAHAYVIALRKANGTYVEKEEDTAGVLKGSGDDGGLPPGTGTLFQ